MTLSTMPSPDLLTDDMISPGIQGPSDVLTTEASYEDWRFGDSLSSSAVSWTARLDVPARGGKLVVQGTGKEPVWLRRVLESVAELLALEYGWDSYAAPQISPDAVVDAIRILLELADTIEIEIPVIVPTTRGGIQLEWQRPGVVVELEVNPGAQPSLLVEHTQGGEDFEGPVAQSHGLLRTALASS